MLFSVTYGRKDPQTHRLFFAKHFENQDGLETKEADETDQWPELVQNIESDIPIIRTAKTRDERVGVAEGSIKGYEPRADEESDC